MSPRSPRPGAARVWRSANRLHALTWALALLSLGLGSALAAEVPMSKRVRACTACHGEENIEIAEGYVPRIRGKPAGYLFNQLMNYRAHRRHNDTMNHLVRNLSASYLSEVAEHFAAQLAPYPRPAAPPEDAAVRQRGAALVERGDPGQGIPSCRACHGERLTGVLPNTPGLIGLPQHYISAQLNNWQLDRRQAAAPDCMAAIADRMSPRDIRAVAAWLASRPLPDDTRPDDEPVGETPLECGVIPRPGQ